MTWASTNLAFFGFRRALRAQGVAREGLPYRSPWQPYAAVYGLFFRVLITLTQGFTAFIPHFRTADFFAAYISLVLFVIVWLGHKIVTQSAFVGLSDVDLARGEAAYESKPQGIISDDTLRC